MVIEEKFCLSRQLLLTLSDLYKPTLKFRNRLIMHFIYFTEGSCDYVDF